MAVMTAIHSGRFYVNNYSLDCAAGVYEPLRGIRAFLPAGKDLGNRTGIKKKLHRMSPVYGSLQILSIKCSISRMNEKSLHFNIFFIQLN